MAATTPPRREGAAFHALVLLGFVLFLAVAVPCQLLGLAWRDWLPGAEGAKSVLGGVRSAVYSFMSYLN